MRRHLTGTLSFGLDGAMSTWLGWLLPTGQPLTLLGESSDQVAAAQRDLARIGVDRPAAAATGTPEQWAGGDAGRLGALTVATFADLAAARAGRAANGLPAPGAVLDVRLGNEWRDEHIDGAIHIPLPELPDRLAELPSGAIWVHCGSGYRAAVAAGLLDRAGHQVVHVDDAYSNAAAAGLATVPGRPGQRT
jgi:rhodanese-related sulfurtransferase